MATHRKSKSDASEEIHSLASGPHRVFPPIPPEQIKSLRQRHGVSQREFAGYLNTSVSTVQKWETGAKKPGGIALRLLSIVERHGLEMLA